MDGILRYFEIRYSMFYALFVHCALLPIFRAMAQRHGVTEKEAWRLLKVPLR